MKTPDKAISDIIKTHDYKGVFIKKTGKETFTVKSINPVPGVIVNYIQENYNMIFWSSNFIEFKEFKPIGVETYYNNFM